MKKFLKILVVALLGLINNQANSQDKKDVGWPLLPYNENGYTVAFVKDFAHHSTDPIREDWLKNMLALVNSKLTEAGVLDAKNQPIKVDESSVDWIMENVKDSSVVLKDFKNSRKDEQFSKTLNFFTDHNTFKGIVGVFSYKNCRFILYKTICLNLLDIPLEKSFLPAKLPDPVVTTVKTPYGDINISLYNINNNTITGSGNSTVTGAGPNAPTTGSQYLPDYDNGFRQTNWGGYPDPIMPRMNVYQLGLQFGGGQQVYQQPSQQLEERYMHKGTSYQDQNNNSGTIFNPRKMHKGTKYW